MALDPDKLLSLPDTLVDMYGLVEIDILSDMARRISTYDYFIPAAQHQLQKLEEMNAVRSDIIAALSSLTGKSQQEIVNLLSEASAEAIADDIEYYTAGEVYAPDKVNSEALHEQLNAGLRQTEQAFFNITGTTALVSSNIFVLALDRAWTQINTGGFDYNTAIKNAIKDLSAAGLGSIKYKSGRVDSLEVAVRRAVMTGANQTAAKTQEVLADQLGVDLVETTAHGGARPAHAKWQGKVFSRNGRVTIDGVTYEDFRKATGYGTGAGLCGWNCHHNFHPYIPGASRAYSDKQLKDFEAKNIEYNGKKYTEYEASQIQRKIERNIRANKRTVAALEAGGQDASAERKKLRDAQKKYTDFTKQTGLKKQSARTQIGTVTANKNINNAVKPLENSVINDKIQVDKGERQQSGAQSGARKSDGWETKHAETYYEEVKNRKPYADANRIKNNVRGFTAKDIEEIRQHVFIKAQPRDGGIKPFDPDYEQAQVWQRLIEGKNVKPSDLVFLKHELYELTIMREKNLVYEEAHDMANEKYNWQNAIDEEE